MSEEKKEDNVEALLEKTLELLAPKVELPIAIELPEITHFSAEPTCSLIRPKPRKKFKWHKTIAAELEKKNEDVMPNPEPRKYTAECACGNTLIASSYAVPGTFGVDHDLRATALRLSWMVTTRLSGALEFGCPGCQLKAA